MSARPLGRPLKGVRIVDLTRLLPGPFATVVFGDMGADVLKIEAPRGGDYTRYFQPFVGSMGAFFASINRNKRSVALDLKTPGGLGALRRLLEGADVLIESFRPGVLDKLGIGFDVLARDFPRLVVCSISGFGQTGPMRREAGHDITYLARAGVLATTGHRDGRLALPGFQLADIAGGSLYAVSGVLAALFARERTGEGAHIDISMTDGAMSFMIPMHGTIAAGQRFEGPSQGILDGGVPCYCIYETRDGGHMALGALEPKFWIAFCGAVGREEYATDGLASGARGRDVQAALVALFKTRTRDEWAALLDGVDCCCEPVRRPEEALMDPLFVDRGLFFELDSPSGLLTQTATPLTPQDKAGFRPPPQLGEHTREVLTECGLSEAEIEALFASGAVV